jgi:hypothetical protein
MVACGKKGPPLPPLVKLPVAPAEVTAARRAGTVDLQLTVPSANTDNTRPANVARVDVYAYTGPPTVSDAQVLKQGTKVASIAVKTPRDPQDTFDPDDPDQSEADVEPPEGTGLDQGAIARVQETLPPPAVAASPTPAVRTYVSFAVTPKGKRGPSSRRVAVPLVPPPPAPANARAMYTETAVTLTWEPVALLPEPIAPPALPDAAASGPSGATSSSSSAAPPALPGATASPSAASPPSPASPLGASPRAASPPAPPAPRLGYNVYEITGASQAPLTKMPTAGTTFADSRMTWGVRRCYGVRAVETVGALTVESEETAPACVVLTDTFAPAPPKGLQAVASEGVINLIWDANTEADLDGYVLLRGVAPAGELAPVTPAPIHETAFQDHVAAGVRYVYAVTAVDKAGNVSAPSERTEETAR